MILTFINLQLADKTTARRKSHFVIKLCPDSKTFPRARFISVHHGTVGFAYIPYIVVLLGDEKWEGSEISVKRRKLRTVRLLKVRGGAWAKSDQEILINYDPNSNTESIFLLV